MGGHDSCEFISWMATCSGTHISQPKSDGAICKGRALQINAEQVLLFLVGRTWKPSCGEEGTPPSHKSSVQTSWDAETCCEPLSLRRERPQAGTGGHAELHLPCLTRKDLRQGREDLLNCICPA